ncbi:MAG: tetratricopeptide repeat protein [Nitrospirae bacterium]|nr:tetratricopeptide repeat protein [Nitrospirota bacterium]
MVFGGVLVCLMLLCSGVPAAWAGPIEDAQALLAKNQVPQALALLEGHVAGHPDDRAARLLLANVRGMAGDLPGAYALYEGLLAGAPEGEVIAGQVRALFAERGASADAAKRIEALFGQVQQAMQQGDMEQAVQALTEVARLAPGNLAALHNLSQILEQQRRFAEAVPYVEALVRQRPGDVNNRLRLAGLYERVEQPDKAVAAYEQALERQPKNPIALYSIGRIALFVDKDYPRAADFLARALAVDPNRPDIAYLIGVSHNEGGDKAAAVEAFRRSVALDDHFYQAHFEIGLILEAEKQDAEALEHFRKVARDGGTSPQAEQSRRRIALFGGDARVAGQVKALITVGIERLAASDLPGAKTAFDDVLALVPGNTLARYNLATVLTREGNADAAVDQLAKALESDPTHYLSHYGLALIHIGAGRFEEAYEAYKMVAQWSPADSPYHKEAIAKVELVESVLDQYKTKLGARKAFLKGNKLAKEGDFAEAVKAYEEAIQQDPENSFYHYNAGVSYMELARLGEAFKAFRKALEIKPDHIQSHFRLALFYSATGFPQEAIKSFKEVIRYGTTEPEVAEAQARLADVQSAADTKEKALAYLIMANALGAELNDLDKALIALEHAYAMNPGAKEITARYAELLMQMRREDEALALLAPLNEKDPDDFRVAWDLAQIYKTKRDWEKGEPALLTVIRLKPEFGRAASMLADLQERTGRTEEAIQTLKDFVEAHPTDRETVVDLLRMMQRRGRDADAAGLIDWYLSSNKETAEMLYVRGALAKKLGASGLAQTAIKTDAAAQSVLGTEEATERESGARYQTANEWFARAIEVADKGDEKWVALAKQELATAKRLSMSLSQQVFEFNTNANNSSTEPKAGVLSEVQFSATYTAWRWKGFSLPLTFATRHRMLYTFQTYVNTNTLRAQLPSSVPLFVLTPDLAYSMVRTQDGPVSSTMVMSTSAQWRPRFPSALNGSYQYTEFRSDTNRQNDYVQDLITAAVSQDLLPFQRFRLNVGANYSRSARDVVAVFRDSEQEQLRYEASVQVTLPRRHVVSLKGWQANRTDLLGSNRRGDVLPAPPPLPMDAVEVGGEMTWWFQVYPNVRGRAFGRYSVSDLTNVVLNTVDATGKPISSISQQQETSTAFGLEFTYRPSNAVSWVLSMRQDERQAAVDIAAEDQDVLLDQVVQDNINKQQTITLQMSYAF